ncbi:MAG: helicase [Bifidobacterium scardovii]|jgi:hypothetical protein|uniref:helicase n=1 Tax=Bifidobacterium scardovii TaxID=158787 RepID=UPI0020653AD7|nr:helicase [Bifidobacterium scardovii]MDU2421294.1 helicase [Bifidobacterium scardovii]DAZ29448.1 MAG TPA: Major head protein [Caudoviricetes sp.]
MFRNRPPFHIRLIDTPPAGNGGTNDPATNDGGEGGEQIDYEAKYREALGHLRELEKKAKANKTAAEELEKLKASQMSEAEKAAKHTKELEDKVAAYEAAKQQTDWAKQVSETTGVPANVLRGSTLEEIQAHAESLKTLLAPKLPKVPDPAKHPEGKTANERAKAYVKALFGNND